MEIENNGLSTLSSQSAPASAPQRDQAESRQADSAAATPPANTVNITSGAQQLQQLESEIAQQPVVDSQRVDAVREAINDGSFEVNPSRIADKLISLERALTDAS